MIRFCSLSSGSSGNAALLQLGRHNIIIDAGLSLRGLDQGLAKLNFSPWQIDLILLTHAHSDHSKSIAQFSAKYKKPVYMTRETYNSLTRQENLLADLEINFFKQELKLEEAMIHIFRLPHTGVHHAGLDDAGGNVGFLFTFQKDQIEKKMAYFTDLGVMPEFIIPHIHNCDFYFLEANHDVLWQKASRRPVKVIERNLSSFGHLSNEQTAEVLTRVIHKDPQKRKTKSVMLAHISKECNSHILAKTTIEKNLSAKNIEDLEIKIAPEKALSEEIII